MDLNDRVDEFTPDVNPDHPFQDLRDMVGFAAMFAVFIGVVTGKARLWKDFGLGGLVLFGTALFAISVTLYVTVAVIHEKTTMNDSNRPGVCFNEISGQYYDGYC